MKEKVLKEFRSLYGREASFCFFAPGRANLIGEHIDYNGGHVLPCALTMGTYAAARKRPDRTINLHSLNYPEDQGWTAYVYGVLSVFAARGMEPDTGLDLLIGGDLPPGAGLSSSASLEVLTGFILKELYHFDLTMEEIALIGREAERLSVGVECGIMDQFACALGREGHAIDLDTETLDCSYVPLPMEEVSLIMTDSKVKHDLKSSAYNERRRQCARALELLNGRDPGRDRSSAKAEDGADGMIPSLCSLTLEEFEKIKDRIGDPLLRKRAAHAVSENDRVIRAVEALKANSFSAFGELMNQSHWSLAHNYEVSCPELDLLAETARRIPGVYGCRMLGGGFGGCTIALVRSGAAGDFRETVGRVYRERTGLECVFYEAKAGSGPRRIGLQACGM